jgi:drug/metabolite transporter (DMT)-like permease
MTPHLRGVLLLVVVTFFWGSTFPIGKLVYAYSIPSVLLACRYLLSGLFLIREYPRITAFEWRWGVAIGVIQFACVAAVYHGLRTVPASRSAFLLSASVFLIPMAERVLGRRVTPATWIAVAAGLTGVALLTDPDTGFTTGDLWTLASAVMFTGYVLLIDRVQARTTPLRLTAVQVLTIGIGSLVWMVGEGSWHVSTFASLWPVWGWVLYLAITAIATLTLQTLAQRWVPASEAGLLFTLEPVFAALLAGLMLGEWMYGRALLGAGLIVAANVFNQLMAARARQLS